VIVVDDDSQIRESLENLLKSAEFGTAAFSTAEDALQSGILAKASCLITDVRMPGMNGLELQRRIKREYPRLPVIVITAHCDEKIRESALSEGAVTLLFKPFDANYLLLCIQEAMQNSTKASEIAVVGSETPKIP
jgi:FixJ family two-component response regulator